MQRFDRRLADDRLGKCAREQLFRFMSAQSPRAQVKKCGFVELADGRAVAALDVIGVDFEFRLGVDFGLSGQQQVVICLFCVRAVGAFVDDRLAIPDSAGFACEDAAIFLARYRRSRAVIDARVVVDMLAVADEVQATELAAAARLRDVDSNVVANQPAAEVEGGVAECGVTANGGSEMAGLAVFITAVLDADQVDLAPSCTDRLTTALAKCAALPPDW